MHRNVLRLIPAAFALLLAAAGSMPAQAAGPEELIEFPKDARFLDVRDFGAKGDGVHDDTEALQKTFAAAERAGRDPSRENKAILIPSGTYIVSEPIEYSAVPGLACRLIVHGAGRHQTIIKLRNRAGDFQDKAKPRAVLTTFTGKQTNEAFLVQIDDLTIDIGAENPAAIGLRFVANNVGGLRNIGIVSSDPDKAGAIGLDLSAAWVGPALFDHVSIEGFDTGILTRSDQYGVTFKALTLRDQRVVGLNNPDNSIVIDGFESRNAVPALSIAANGFVALVRGRITAPQNTSAAAITITTRGVLHMVDTVIEGYEKSRPGVAGAIALGSGAPRTLLVANGAIRTDPPEFDLPKFTFDEPVREPVTAWARPEDRTGAAIQAALDSGRSTVYLPRGWYTIADPIRIPPTVKRLTGFASRIALTKDFPPDKPVFTIDPDRKDNLLIEEMDFWSHAPLSTIWIRNPSAARVMIRDTLFDGAGYDGGTPALSAASEPTVFLVNVGGIKRLTLLNQNVAAWQLNPEGDSTKIVLQGGRLSVYGLKTEGWGSILEAQHAHVTIFGGLLFVNSNIPSDLPAFDLHDSSACLSIPEVSNFPKNAGHTEFTVLSGSSMDRIEYHRVSEFPRHGAGPVFPAVCSP